LSAGQPKQALLLLESSKAKTLTDIIGVPAQQEIYMQWQKMRAKHREEQVRTYILLGCIRCNRRSTVKVVLAGISMALFCSVGFAADSNEQIEKAMEDYHNDNESSALRRLQVVIKNEPQNYRAR
jgi:hypothetical protein